MYDASNEEYAKLDRSPPPPLPVRYPNSNGISYESGYELPTYDVPDIPRKENNAAPPVVTSQYEDLDENGRMDPYYDKPEDLNVARVIPPARAPKKYYEDMDIKHDTGTRHFGAAAASDPDEGHYDMSTVPLPAVILSGSLQRQIDQKDPDFAYPTYRDGFSPEDFPVEQDYDQIYSETLDPTMLNHEYEFDRGSHEAMPYSAIYEDPKPLKISEAPLQVTKDHIIEVRKLGTGQFGHVILAKTRGLSLKDLRLSEDDTDRSQNILVAIKKLKPDAETGLMEAFDKEVKFMSRLNHDNVVRLLGVCRDMESFIMMEYMENGDLNQFLQRQRLMPDTITGLQENEVTPVILLYIGVQMASGMHYLASRRFVHRDLATRNCLVGKDFIVKISDFGMSRSLYESAYYRVQGTLVLPIRWMACETFYGKFSVKSDSWAFGVSLWEIYTLGKVDPYDSMTDEEVIADAIRGPDRLIPERPEVCPAEVYDIMLRCWVNEPSMRADFGEIYSRLFMIYTRQAL